MILNHEHTIESIISVPTSIKLPCPTTEFRIKLRSSIIFLSPKATVYPWEAITEHVGCNIDSIPMFTIPSIFVSEQITAISNLIIALTYFQI